MARPSLLTPEVSSEICERIACGESLAAICREDGMPADRTVMRWLRDNEAFRLDYARAREEQADSDADFVSDIAKRTLSGEFEPAAARAAIDAYKWTAGKRNAKKYGERQVIAGDPEAPLQVLGGPELEARIAELWAKVKP